MLTINAEIKKDGLRSDGTYNVKLRFTLNRKMRRLATSLFATSKDYLFKGDVTDFDTNPKEADTLDENEDFQLGILKAMIDAGKTIQYVPLFREHPESISAILPCFKGKIMFRIKRTDETLDYLREHKQII